MRLAKEANETPAGTVFIPMLFLSLYAGQYRGMIWSDTKQFFTPFFIFFSVRWSQASEVEQAFFITSPLSFLQNFNNFGKKIVETGRIWKMTWNSHIGYWVSLIDFVIHLWFEICLWVIAEDFASGPSQDCREVKRMQLSLYLGHSSDNLCGHRRLCLLGCLPGAREYCWSQQQTSQLCQMGGSSFETQEQTAQGVQIPIQERGGRISGVVTNWLFLCPFCKKKSLICLEGKLMTPDHTGDTLFPFIPHSNLLVSVLKGFLSWLGALSWHGLSFAKTTEEPGCS